MSILALQKVRSWRAGYAASVCMTSAVILSLFLLRSEAHALITGGVGSDPIRDPGWPEGAAAVFNTTARVAWWEGPPFGGGQSHAECRGDAAELSKVLKDFAKVNATNKHIILLDGVGHSFWLNPNREADKEAAARIDWTFEVWQPERWRRLQSLPADLRPRDVADNEAPGPRITVYTGGSVDWADVEVPEGIEVSDQRLSAHGFSVADGIVLEGTILDIETSRPLAGRIVLQRVESQPSGGYQHTTVAETVADSGGHWVLKSAPPGRLRIVVEAEEHVPRVAGYEQFSDQPRWRSYSTTLAKAAPVSGSVVDEAGQPISDAKVRLQNVVASGDETVYGTPHDYSARSDDDGNFRIDAAPVGKATVSVSKPGYVRPGLGLPIEIPASDVSLKMAEAAAVTITVDFINAERPAGYIVHMIPEGGEAVGKWSGSGTIDEEGSFTFKNVPPGRYVVTGRPNPGSDDRETEPKTIEVSGGENAAIDLTAK